MLEAEREFKTAQTHSGAKRKEQIIEDALFNYLLVKKKKKKETRANTDEPAQTPTGRNKQPKKKKTGKELRARGVMR